MTDEERFGKLLDLGKKRQNETLPIGFAVETVIACIEQTLKHLPKEKSKEACINYIVNTILVSLVATFVSFGNEKEIKRIINEIFNDRPTKIMHLDEDEEETKH